ncbi:response regulator transcription factor [Paenibacillus radicis (ex Xue et al. 2023)]|uniref:Response regulator n=1 Tax=Paenibacillus radicis (ex Xue et al. 2023) TaxID=2972489 RepID=A0ABT1YMA4_9BACL|nr:response regulator [Paenibacillus radicis (ex Xue et al. 2023)]MCR8634308.1 response regulator [Paenibacillus radicis (ex Xue et al. 2023)]
MKLVIADDQQSTHQFLHKMIEWKSLGITEVHHAFHGKEAVELIAELSPDLLILDLKMPMLDGIGVLREIRDLPQKPKTMILSAHDEFEYARDAMRFGVQHYLLKPIDIVAVSQAVEILRKEVERETRDHLEGLIAQVCRFKTMDAVTSQLIHIGFQALAVNGYLCVYVKEPDMEAGQAVSLLPTSPCQFAVRINNAEAYIVHGLKEEQAASDIARLYENGLPDSAVIGISAVQRQADLLVTGLLQCESAAKVGFYEGGGVYVYSESMFTEALTQHQTDEMVRGMLAKLELDYSEQAWEKAVSTMFAAFRDKKVKPEAVYQICCHLLFMMLSKKQGYEAKFSVSMLEAQQTLEQLQQLFSQYMVDIIGSMLKPSFAPEDTIYQIKQYVESNCSEDLSLDSMAAKFIMNKYQLCRLFKREFDVSYWSYVTMVRMQKAAELLLYTSYKVVHIGQKVGYPDESHFSNAFKKYYGIRPKDYKHKHTQESSTTNQ